MSRIFYNPGNIRGPIALLRIRKADPLAHVEVYDNTPTDEPGGVISHYVRVDSVLSGDEIVTLLAPAEAQAEIDVINNYVSASSEFDGLPGWATWTAAEAGDYITGNILGGLTQAQVETQIDALPATIAGMKTGLKQVAAALISIRSVLVHMAKAIVFLRNLVVSVRR